MKEEDLKRILGEVGRKILANLNNLDFSDEDLFANELKKMVRTAVEKDDSITNVDKATKEIFNSNALLDFVLGLNDYSLYQEAKYRMMLDMMGSRRREIIYINSEHDDAKCSEDMKNRYRNSLGQGLSFDDDIVVNEKGVSGDFLLGDTYHACEFPIEAIWGLRVEGEASTILFYRDTPDEVLEKIELNKKEMEEDLAKAKELEKKRMALIKEQESQYDA